MKAWNSLFPDAPIVHDRFHIAAYLGKAVDTVRKWEHRILKKNGDDRLTGAKYLFLKNENNRTEAERVRFQELMEGELKVGRAWTLKESFRHFFDCLDRDEAKAFFKRWYFRATHSRLKPMIGVAKLLKRHLDGLLAYCEHGISNAVTEGLNAKIQSIKASARGFRSFKHYRIAILFSCGKLDMMP
jgi:transposase